MIFRNIVVKVYKFAIIFCNITVKVCKFARFLLMKLLWGRSKKKMRGYISGGEKKGKEKREKKWSVSGGKKRKGKKKKKKKEIGDIQQK